MHPTIRIVLQLLPTESVRVSTASRRLRPQIDESPPPLAAALTLVGGGNLGPALGAEQRSLKLEFGQRSALPWWLWRRFAGQRIRYTRLLVHLVGGDLAGGVEEGGDSPGRRFHAVVDLIQSTCVNFVSEDLDQFKGSMPATSALGR